MKRKIIVKLTSLGLCLCLALTCAITAGAASTDDEISGEGSVFTALSDTVYIADNYLYFSPYNTPEDSRGYFKFYSSSDEEDVSCNFTAIPSEGKYQKLLSGETYRFSLGIRKSHSSSGSGTGTYRSYAATGGRYQKLRIKLSYFSDNFNSDGTYDSDEGDYGKISYAFGSPQTKSGTTFYSALCIRSGAAFNAVTPDKDGYAEFYASRQIDEPIIYSTHFSYEKELTDGGWGMTGSYLNELIMGNADSQSGVTIKDAAKVQLFDAGLDTLNEIQRYTADVDSDGEITIRDAAVIQLYCAKLL